MTTTQFKLLTPLRDPALKRRSAANYPSALPMSAKRQRTTNHDQQLQNVSILGGVGAKNRLGQVLAKVTANHPSYEPHNGTHMEAAASWFGRRLTW
jgi:hypothetical protein